MPQSLVNDTERIIGLDDDVVLRNLLITQCYHDLAEGLAGLLGRENANWCNFATWASRTAGIFIRKEEIPAAFRDFIDRPETFEAALESVNTELEEATAESVSLSLEDLDLFALADEVVDYVGQVIMEGNLAVFSELGPLFAKMIHTFGGGVAPEPAEVERFLSLLKEGESEHGGQSTLRRALKGYFLALIEPDHKKKAELILLANCQIGLHEQTRLQPFIAGSLDAPVDVIRNRLTQSVSEQFGSVGDRIDLEPIVYMVKALWQEFATEHLMTLELPEGVLKLGDDVPSPRGKPLFPADLQRLNLPELQELLRSYGMAGPSGRLKRLLRRLKWVVWALLGRLGIGPAKAISSEAQNWARLPDRMTYITGLFRSRQQEGDLFDQPFSAAWRTAILNGRIPPL